MPPTNKQVPNPDEIDMAMDYETGSEGAMPEEPIAPASGGVMITMPRDAFEAIRSIVTELASGLDALSATVAEQAGEMPAEAPQMPPKQAAPKNKGAGAGPTSDEQFLADMVME